LRNVDFGIRALVNSKLNKVAIPRNPRDESGTECVSSVSVGPLPVPDERLKEGSVNAVKVGAGFVPEKGTVVVESKVVIGIVGIVVLGPDPVYPGSVIRSGMRSVPSRLGSLFGATNK
jgi:hypothetical protein